MDIEQNGRQRRVVGDEAFDEDIEEEKVGLGGGEKEVARVVDGLEVGELVGELSKGGEVVVEAVEDDLGVGLREVGESGSLVQEVQEEVAAAWCTAGRRYVSANHYLSVGFGMCSSISSISNRLGRETLACFFFFLFPSNGKFC